MEPTLDDLIKQGEACPYYRLLNMKIDEVKDGYARLTMNLEEKHLQFLRTVHGGAISSLSDSAAAWATVSSTLSSAGARGIPLTVEMKINYLVPVESGRLIAEARVVHKGYTISVSDVEVKDDKGQLVAKSLVTYYIRKNQ
ncbi:MAG: PaaI family thioesterase [Candidatus Bathyarchaeaceae archaeon]